MKLFYLSCLAAAAGLGLVHFVLAQLYYRWRAKQPATCEATIPIPTQELVHTVEVHAFRDTELGYSIDEPRSAQLLQELADLRPEQLMRSMTPRSANTTGRKEG